MAASGMLVYLPLLQTIGNGAIAQSVLSGNINNVDPHGNKFGSFLNINFGYGLGLMIALYASIGVSGGHLNPAVTLAMALRCRLSWLKVMTSGHVVHLLFWLV